MTAPDNSATSNVDADNANRAVDVNTVATTTVSSSSESVFTDPLTPLGFAAELNQCYYSDDNLSDGFTVLPAQASATGDQRRRRAAKLAQLTRTRTDVFDSTAAASATMAAAVELDAPSLELMPQQQQQQQLFTVSRVKKVELPEMPATKALNDPGKRRQCRTTDWCT